MAEELKEITPEEQPPTWTTDPTNPMSISSMLRYCKVQVGATRFNPIELSDVEIVEDVWKQISFPIISSYIPHEIQYLIRKEDLLTGELRDTRQHTKFVYQLNPKLHIQSIQKVMYSETISNNYYDYSLEYNSRDGVSDPYEQIKIYDDLVIQDYFKDIFNARIIWNELPKNRIEFQVEDNDIYLFENSVKVANINVFHEDTITMDTDMLPTIRKLLLSDLMIIIGQIRSRFNNMQTIHGSLEINSERMLSKGEELKREAIEEFENIPPREFFYFINKD